MRGVVISMAAAFLLAIAVPAQASVVRSSDVPAMAAPAPVVFALQQVPDKTIDINVTHGEAKWYANPIVIGIGVVALILVLLLVVLAARGGGTTIVKE